MRKVLVLAAVCTALATAALAQTRPASQSPTTSGAAPTAPTAQEFVNKIAISDMFEVQAGELALAKAHPTRTPSPSPKRW